MSELEERDWQQLLPELIHLIAKKLPDVLNFIRFRAICKTWQSSAPLSDPPTQFPWIYEYPQYNNNDSDSDSEYARARPFFEGLTRFYSVSSAETLTINVRAPHINGYWSDYMTVCCHNVPFVYHRSYFAERAHISYVHLYNPLTKKQFALERIPLPLRKPVIVWTGSDSLCNRNMLIFDNIYKFTRNPEERAGLAFFDPHHKSWVIHKGSFSNAFLCQGMLFKTYANGYTMVSDLSSKLLYHNIPPPDNDLKPLDDKKILLPLLKKQRTYIVESGGIILRVSWIYHWQGGNIRNAKDSIFHINKLQFDGVNGKPCWVSLKNIGNQVLFLVKRNAFSMTARPSSGFKEGCIYFMSPYYKKPYVHDVLAGTTEKVPVPSSFGLCSWFVPGLC